MIPYSTHYLKPKTNCSSFELGFMEQLSFSAFSFKKEKIPVIFHDYEPLRLYKKPQSNIKRKRDTLIFWKDKLIEYNPRPSKHKIHEIKASFLGRDSDDICCNPHFEVRYTQDSIFYQGNMWIELGKEEAKNNTQEYEAICEILNYIIDFEQPEQDFREDKDDEIQYIIEISYDDHKKLKIIDGPDCYCTFSSFGLNILYNTILDIKFISNRRYGTTSYSLFVK